MNEQWCNREVDWRSILTGFPLYGDRKLIGLQWIWAVQGHFRLPTIVNSPDPERVFNDGGEQGGTC